MWFRIIFKNKDWSTIVYGTNGSNFDSYLDSIYEHEFVLCPVGVGIDTHRLWECLYMGIIPIEKTNKNNINYSDLPICFVNSWSDINEDFLEKKYIEIKNKNWNLEKLNFNYWKNKILELWYYIVMGPDLSIWK